MTTPLQIGVLLEEVQFSDVIAIDIFGNLSKEYNEAVEKHFQLSGFAKIATPMVFHYISSSLSLTHMTPNLKFLPTVTYDEAPRDLDILIIGGPIPGFNPPGADKFLREQKSKVVITTCIGSLWLASAGQLKGKKATTNRGALPMAKMLYPDTEWLDQRWVVDGNLWTAGGAGAGVDMVVTYVKKHFPEKLVDFAVIDALEFNPAFRGQFYPDNVDGQRLVGDIATTYWVKGQGTA